MYVCRYECMSNLRTRKPDRANQNFNFLGGGFNNREKLRAVTEFDIIPESYKIIFSQEQTHPF